MGVRIPPPLPLIAGEGRDEMGYLKRAKEFVGEVLAEFRKVTWPSRQELINSTVVVIAVTVVVAFFLGGMDIMRQMEAGAEKPKPKSVFQRGDKVRVVDGPFVNFQGVVEDMNPERGRMKVAVPVFGRPTSVELEYYQVERL